MKKKKYRIFLAIPFDSASRSLYEGIKKKITEQFPEFELTMIFGIEQVRPSEKYPSIDSFKAQNQQLISRFTFEIQQADVIIADLTNNNPNVHFELGIALANNKNILRVTGRSLMELGFDIRGLEVHQYDNYGKLEEIVVAYLTTFFRIKQLSISSHHGELYWKEPEAIELKPSVLTPMNDRFIHKVIRGFDYKMRDGAVRVKFNTIDVHKSSDNWFGVYFRASYNPFLDSYLLFVRPNGTIELTAYPGPTTIEKPRTYPCIKGSHNLLIQFADNRMNVEFDGNSYLEERSILTRQTKGYIFVAAWNAVIDVQSVEMICRETLA